MPFFPLLMLLAADPETGPVKSFGDWAVACDNVEQCEMTSLVPVDGVEAEAGYDEISFSVVRAAGPQGGFSVEAQMPGTEDGSEVSIRIDAEIIAGAVPKNGLIRFTGAPAARIVAAMAKGREMSIADMADSLIGRVSLKGSSAALRFVDAEQGRAGTVTAVVAKGNKPASAVPAPAALPVVRYIRPAGKPATITPATRKAMNAVSDCDSVYEGGDGDLPEVETVALGGGKTLALLPCGNGAYNFSTIPFIITGNGAPVLAQFDSPLATMEGEPSLTNAGWTAATGTLSTYNKGRGVGDCGASEDYVWDGARFRLVGARAMPECRGSVNWLTVWRAESRSQ